MTGFVKGSKYEKSLNNREFDSYELGADNLPLVRTKLLEADIQIGAVEIKDAESDTRQKVKTDGTDNAAVVTQNSQPLPTGAATSDNQTNKTQMVQITNGTNEVEVNSSGQLHTVMRGHLCTDNSSETPLLAGAVFTGSSEDTLDYAAITVWVSSDVASAVGGMVVQYSDDEADWHSGEAYTILAGAEKFFTPTLQMRYFRVVYTNGAADQTIFHLHTTLRKNPIKWSSHNITDPIVDEDDATLSKSVITGKRVDGTYGNVNLTNGNNMKISFEELESGISSNSNSQLNTSLFSTSGTAVEVTANNELTTLSSDFALEVARGNVSGLTYVHKFGAAPDFDTGDNEVSVWDGAEDNVAWELMNYVYSTTADITHLSSDSASDTEVIEVQGLNAAYELVVQTKTLTGVAAVELDTPLMRVFRMKNTGSNDLVGHVFCSVGAAGGTGIPTANTIRGIIQIGNNQTEMAQYTVPAGKTAYVQRIYSSTAGGSRSTNFIMRFLARPVGGVFQLKYKVSMNENSPSEKIYDVPQAFAEKTDIQILTQITESAITGASVIAGFDILLVDN